MPAPPNDDEVATKEPCRMPARSPAGSVDLLEEDDDEEDMVRDSLREDVICMIFDLPKSTKFYRYFSCAIASKFAMHGRMYPTSTHVCFYSNVFGRERKILMPYDSIAEIAKTTTMMIQNAIRITTTAGDDYTFTSFWGNNRDRCFSLIVRIRNRALGLTVSPTSSPSISPMSDPPETPSSEIGPLNDDTSPREVESKPLEPEDENRTSIVADVGLAAPKDISMTQVLEETFNVSVDKFLDSFILDGAPFGLDEFNRRIGSTELECDPWTQSTDGEESVGTTRSLSFRVPIEAPIGPKSSMVNALQFLMPGDHGMHIIETSTRLVDIPYGDYFSVEDRWTVVPNRGNPNSCTLLIEMKLEFSKSTFWKSKIEQRAKADNKDKFLKWIAMAKEHLESAVVPTEAQQQRSPAATHKKDLKKQDSRAASPRKHARHAQPMASQPKAVRTGRRQLSIRDVGNSLTEKTTALGVHAQEMMTSVERGPYFWKAFPWFIVVILLSVLLQLKASLIRIEDTLSSTTSELRMLQEQVHLLSQIAAQASSRGT
ncbi:TPA: hypothetical protein N0F65_001566 [Lagenidium giganteum]|uniref:VASt domain-containing protein n=1 Tax=Lagenidium giganteum TaxID=4803 RepID=A0AAV2YJK3_9STRA|nr:TPA: hypothetical protein N0F65_001566 [Lagenidium giganteum]